MHNNFIEPTSNKPGFVFNELVAPAAHNFRYARNK